MLVQASGLVKQYPRVRALDQVSLEIKEGEVFGLFGPNGAGKTTCLRVLSGLTQPDAGSATVCGIDVRAAPNEVRRELESWRAERWANIAYGSIYFALNKMAEEGLIEVVDTDQAGKGPARTTYVVTKAGEDEFQRLLRETWWETRR